MDSRETRTEANVSQVSRRKMLSALGLTGAALLTSGMWTSESRGDSVHDSVYGGSGGFDLFESGRITRLDVLREGKRHGNDGLGREMNELAG